MFQPIRTEIYRLAQRTLPHWGIVYHGRDCTMTRPAAKGRPETSWEQQAARRNFATRAKISLTTNGIKLLDWADRLLDANVSAYAVSMHAACAETHNDLMGMGLPAFDKICAGIRYLSEQKRLRRPGCRGQYRVYRYAAEHRRNSAVPEVV